MTINEFLKNINDFYNKDNILKAYEFANKVHAGKKRRNGEDLITHIIEVANILAEMYVSEDIIIAALLHEVLNDESVSYNDIVENFGEDIAQVIESVYKINKLELQDESESSLNYLRKILVGMARDVRVLYIKMADRLHNMRTNNVLSEAKQKENAKETLNILVPIAHRLGMNKIKSELENLCLFYSKPDVYNDILEKLNDSVEKLNDDLNLMKKNLSDIFNESGITFEIKGRVKSVYSIYKKLSTGRKWSDIYDILALRIFVKTESECYTAVGLVHSKYQPIEKRFKDYVANPKENMYQSLHTSVIGENGKVFEIQIRTYEMDLVAERGIASHWSYKEKGSNKIQNIMEQKLEMFRNTIEINEKDNIINLDSAADMDFLKEKIYVYTPKGDVVELPIGATPIDFAYRIHSNVGDTTVGAIVNDLMVPFEYELSDGDVVKVKTSATAKPNKDWLNIVKTPQAKNKIKSYFSKTLRTEYITRGKEILEKDLRKKKISFEDFLSEVNIQKICKDLKINGLEELYLAIGSLRYTSGYIINLSKMDKKEVEDLYINKSNRKNVGSVVHKSDIFVDGLSDVLVNIAKCCAPVKGDDIIGYITKTSGVSVHKKNCENVDCLSDKIINVEWNYDLINEFNKTLFVNVSKDEKFLASLVEICNKKNVKLGYFSKKNDDWFELVVKVKTRQDLDALINSIYRINSVKDVKEDSI